MKRRGTPSHPKEDLAFQRLLKRAIFFPVFLTVIVAISLSWQLRLLEQSREQFEQTEETIRRAFDVRTLTLEMQTGLRAYLLSGRDSYLAPYVNSAEQYPTALSRLRSSLLTGNAYQQEQLQIMESLMARWRQRADQIIALKKREIKGSTDGAVTAEYEWSEGFGNKLMEQIQDELNLLTDGQHDKISDERRRIGRLHGWIEITVVLFLLLVGFALSYFSRKQLLTLSTLYDRALENEKDALRTRDEFLSIASHELKTPLTALGLQIQMLKRVIVKECVGVSSADTIMRLIDSSDKQGQRLTGLLDELLDLTRIRLGKLQMKFSEVNLCERVELTTSQFLAEATRRGSVISIHCDGPVVGTWDEMRIDQIVINLVSNAIKYGDGKPIHVSVQRSLSGDQAILRVQDQGLGIAENMRTKIFERFERVVSDGQIKGLGLGLYIVRQIVEAHGGRIWTESELGKGSTFIVELPIKR